MAGPIVSCLYDIRKQMAGITGTGLRKPEQYDTARRRKDRGPRQLSKILIKGQQDSSLTRRERQHLTIGAAGRHEADPRDIVTGRAEGGHSGAWKVLVGKKAHRQAALGKTFSPLSESRA